MSIDMPEKINISSDNIEIKEGKIEFQNNVNLHYTNVSTSFDDNEIINVYEWQRSGGSIQYKADTNSVLKYRAKENNKTTINVSDSENPKFVSVIGKRSNAEANIAGITPAVLIFKGKCEDSPP